MENVENRRTFIFFTGNRNEDVLLVSSGLISCLSSLIYGLMYTFSVLVEYVSANQFVPGKERRWSPFGHLLCKNFTFL
jgi:hypothetical protein